MVEGESDQLATAAIDEIDAASRTGGVFIAAISVWEVAMLTARKRISLSRPVDDWVSAALRLPGVKFLDLTPDRD